VRYRFIREQHDWHSVKVLCRVMKVSRSGYYGWLKRKPCTRALEDQRLWPKIERMHHRCREAYGAPPGCVMNYARRVFVAASIALPG
jgi:hypothetical protein